MGVSPCVVVVCVCMYGEGGKCSKVVVGCGRPWEIRGEPCGVGVRSLEGKLVEAKRRAEIEWIS